MSAKKFFYVCAGLFLLAAAYHLGAQSAKADWDETLTGPIVGGDGWKFYTRSGEAWEVQREGPPWHRTPAYDLPVPASDVKLVTLDYSGQGRLVTKSGDAWVHDYGESCSWVYVGPFPGGSVQVESKSWSGVKDAFRK